MKTQLFIFLFAICLQFKLNAQTATITTEPLISKTVAQGNNNTPIYILKAVNTGSTTITLTSIKIRATEGTYDANDIEAFKISAGFSTNPSQTISNNDYTYTNTFGAGENNIIIPTNILIAVGNPKYIFVTPVYRSTADDGHTAKFNGANNPIEVAGTGLVVTNGQTDICGIHTIAAPSYTLSTETTPASNVSPGDSPNIYILKLVVGPIPIAIKGFKFTPTGTFTTTEINTFVVGSSSTANGFFATLGGYTGAVSPTSGNLYTIQVPINSTGNTYNANQTIYFAIKPNFKTTATTNKTIKINGSTNPIELITNGTPIITQNQTDAAGEITLKVPSIRITTEPLPLKRAIPQTFNNVLYKIKIENIGELPYDSFGINFNVGGTFTEKEFPKSSINCIVNASNGTQLKNATNQSATSGSLAYLFSTFGANPVSIPVGDFIYLTIVTSPGTLFSGGIPGRTIKINGTNSGFVSLTTGNFGSIENNQTDIAEGLVFDGNLASSIVTGTISNINSNPKCANNNETIIAKVSSPTEITGITNCLLWPTGGNTLGYVPRHYEINPPAASSGASATVTLYFTQAEFNAFNIDDASEFDVPTGPTDLQGIANLRIFKFAGASTVGSNGLVYGSTARTEINPDDNKIVWNALANRWEITFDITGFSGFFVGSASSSLPLNLISFLGKNIENAIQLNWKTTSETNFSHFEIQKSADSKEFGTVGKVDGNNQSFYNFTDTNPTESQNYYKLKMIDLDGTSSFSKTISVNYEKSSYYLSIENPAKKGEFTVKTNYANSNFSMVNSIGKKIEMSFVKTAENQYKITSKINSNGLYFLMMEAQGKILVNKVLVE
jgi:hypothetical protein